MDYLGIGRKQILAVSRNELLIHNTLPIWLEITGEFGSVNNSCAAALMAAMLPSPEHFSTTQNGTGKSFPVETHGWYRKRSAGMLFMRQKVFFKALQK